MSKFPHPSPQQKGFVLPNSRYFANRDDLKPFFTSMITSTFDLTNDEGEITEDLVFTDKYSMRYKVQYSIQNIFETLYRYYREVYFYLEELEDKTLVCWYHLGDCEEYIMFDTKNGFAKEFRTPK